jgi:hypothetical protein
MHSDDTTKSIEAVGKGKSVADATTAAGNRSRRRRTSRGAMSIGTTVAAE